MCAGENEEQLRFLDSTGQFNFLMELSLESFALFFLRCNSFYNGKNNLAVKVFN